MIAGVHVLEAGLPAEAHPVDEIGRLLREVTEPLLGLPQCDLAVGRVARPPCVGTEVHDDDDLPAAGQTRRARPGAGPAASMRLPSGRTTCRAFLDHLTGAGAEAPPRDRTARRVDRADELVEATVEQLALGVADELAERPVRREASASPRSSRCRSACSRRAGRPARGDSPASADLPAR